MAQSDWTRLGGITRDTYVATGANVENYVAGLLGATYKAKGSVAFASLPAPAADKQGWVYNVTDAFTTTSAFVEGAGKSYPAGTNVVCVNTSGSTYAWDVLSGMTDLSGYVPTSRTVNGKPLSSDVTISASDIATPGTTGTTLSDWASSVESAMADIPGIGAAASTAVQSVKISGSSTELKSGTTATIPVASTSAKGVVQLSDATNSDVSTTAATSKAVKAAKDAADAAATAASSAGTTASNNATARKTTLKTAIDTMYSRSTYPDKASLYAALANMDDLADTLADLIIALRGFCDAS